MNEELHFAVRGDHITLDALLKATGLAPSGGAAKTLIAAGAVQVDGGIETRRGRKLRAGMRVQVGDRSVRLHPAEPA
jgi:ribosome-associated protein